MSDIPFALVNGLKGSTMTGFDITSILDFQPPAFICPACRGLMRRYKTDFKAPQSDIARTTCPVCSVNLVFDQETSWADTTLDDYFANSGHKIDRRDLLAHATTLARLVSSSRATSYSPAWPTARLFLETMGRAKHFVHFASWGMSHIMIGALKATSMRVPVYGFVSNLGDSARMELTEFPTESPQLHAKALSSRLGLSDTPHQKIIIIDGLLAFKGSTNLTQAGMRSADRGLDISEVVTDFAEVTELNNRYFAPVWRRLNHPAESFTCSSAPF